MKIFSKMKMQKFCSGKKSIINFSQKNYQKIKASGDLGPRASVSKNVMPILKRVTPPEVGITCRVIPEGWDVHDITSPQSWRLMAHYFQECPEMSVSQCIKIDKFSSIYYYYYLLFPMITNGYPPGIIRKKR